MNVSLRFGTPEILESQRIWLSAARRGEAPARAAALQAVLKMKVALLRMGENLGRLGYPCRDLIRPCRHELGVRVSAIEEAIHSPLPEVLKLIWSEVGGISFVDLESYSHVRFWEESAFWEGKGTEISEFCDGVVIDACDLCWSRMICNDARDERGRASPSFVLYLSPDGYHKDNISGGDPYGIRLGSDWLPAWEKFWWSGPITPRSAGESPGDLLGYLRSAILECAGFPAYHGCPGFEELAVSILDGVEVF